MKKVFVILALLLLFAPCVATGFIMMQCAEGPSGGEGGGIVYDTTETAQTSSGGTTLTLPDFALGFGSGNNRIVLACIHYKDGAGSNDAISGATFNGVAMSAQGSPVTTETIGWYSTSHIYYMLDSSLPSSAGDYDVVITWAGSIRNATMIVISLTGAKQTSNPKAEGNNSALSNTTISANVTTATNNAWLVSSLGVSTDDNSVSPGSGQTERAEIAVAGTYELRSAAGTELIPTAGAQTDTWNSTGTEPRLVLKAVSVAPAS